MRNQLIQAVASILVLASAALPIEILNPDQITVGMTGVGRSVFRGSKPEEFQVEVLGVLKKAYAGNDLILVKCRGANLEHTGVIAGMSGSPVYIDGKLIGAIAMTYGFQKDAIALITPAAAMLEVMERRDLPEEELGSLNHRHSSGGAVPITMPVVVTGLNSYWQAVFAPDFEQQGMKLLSGGNEVTTGSDSAALQLEPGSAVGVAFIRGDMTASGIGTVTHRSGNRIVAFGHPMFSAGAVNLPMVGGVVHTIMASQELSFKIFSPTAPIGAITQDRACGIAGTIGPKVPMIPVQVTVTSSEGQRVYHYEVLNHRLLMPLLFSITIANALTSREQAAFEFSAQAAVDLKLRGRPRIHNNRWFSGTGLNTVVRELAAPLEYLLNNEFERVAVESLAVSISVTPGIRRLVISRVTPDRERAKPGDKLRLTVLLDAWRGARRTEVLEITIPQETPEGRLEVLVASPDSALDFSIGIAGENFRPRNLQQMIRLVEQLGDENQIVVQGYSRKKGVVIAGEKFPNLPASMLALLRQPRDRGSTNELELSLLFERRFRFDQLVAGSQFVSIMIEP